jgi:hypothetical protein
MVFMSDNRKIEPNFTIAEYNSLAASINYEYCKKHKYDFLYYRPYLDNKYEYPLLNCKNFTTGKLRHASWSKLLSTLLALELDYDYVVYTDSDCIFKDVNQSLDVFIKPHRDKDVIFLNNKPWGDKVPCAGFYICKVTETTKQFIHDWFNTDIPKNNTSHPWEQDSLWEIFKKYNMGIVDSWMFREDKTQLLRHVGGNESYNRIPYFTSFIKSTNIDYKKNITEIRMISFDTV